MSSVTVCSRCLRALRAASRAQQPKYSGSLRVFPALHQKSSYQSSQRQCSRSFGTSPSRWQQAAQKQRPPPSEPPPIPSTTSTPNTNIHPPSQTSSGNTNDSSPLPDSLSTAQMQRHIATNLSRTPPSLSTNLAQSLRRAIPNTATTYLTYGLTESLFNSCSAHTAYTIPQAQRTQILSGTGPPKTAGGEDIGVPDDSIPSVTRSFFLSTPDQPSDQSLSLGLLPTFSTWSQTTFLHMYLLTVRLRSLPASTSSQPGSFQNFQQYLLEHFSQAAENHMLLLHTISARGIRNRYLKDLFLQWRGIIAAYDEGLIKGDAVLGSAVWRNLLKGEEDVDWRKVAMVVGYMRKAVVELERVKDVGELPRRLDGPEGVWARSLKGVRELVGKEGNGIKEKETVPS